MARIRLYSHAPSDTIGRLKETLEAAGHNVKKLKRVGGTYRGREGDIVLNYGASSLESATIGQAECLNPPQMIGRASNKREAFARMEQAGVRTVEYTTTRSMAEQWVRDGALVYVRHQLQGHSGEGIALSYNNPAALGDAGNIQVSADVPAAPLYTKGILGNRREYRVHVFKGCIIHVAQKRRRDGFAGIEGNNNLVRNHHTGWVYSTQNMTALNAAGKAEALKALDAVGLDFGAVDIITNRDEAWVLEVNTAPGMEGVTLEKYTRAISEYANREEITGESVANYQSFRQTTVTQEQPRATSNASRNNASRNEQPAQPAPSQTATAQQQPTTRAVPPAPTAAGQARSRAAAQPALTNGNYYFITMNGEETVGKYVAATNAFEIIGWEPQVEVAEITVVAAVTRG